MDPDKIKERLCALRPDGLDLDDPEVAELLALVEEDLELAEWFAREQVFDQAFAEKLAAIEPPAGLDERIVRAMEAAVRAPVEATPEATAEDGETPAADRLVDFEPAPAVSSPGAAVPFSPTHQHVWWRKPTFISAAAAVVLMLAFSLLLLEPQPLAADEDLDEFYDHIASRHQSPPEMAEKSEHLADLNAYLAAHGAPITGFMPPKVNALREVGCTVGSWQGHPVSILSMANDQLVHLFVIDKDALPDGDDDASPSFADHQAYAILAWTDGSRFYFLVGDAGIGDLL